MITSAQAVELVKENKLARDHCRAVSPEEIYNGEIMEVVKADRTYPPYDRVMMDGIAVNSRVLLDRPAALAIEGVCPAGEKTKTLDDEKNCLEVMTGTVLPKGTDLVIPYEDLSIENGVARLTRFDYRVMDNVHRQGSDLEPGEPLIQSNSMLNGPLWGIITSFGYESIKVKLPKILLVSTGDELVDYKEIPESHQIRRSNTYALRASLACHGLTDVAMHHLTDKKIDIDHHYKTFRNQFDVMIYSGGVSMGKFDFLPEVWEENGVEKIFHKVSQKPGKPLWFGVDRYAKTEVFGLPGNPISSLICLHKYFLDSQPIRVRLAEDVNFKKNLTYFLPASLKQDENATLIACPCKMQNSGQFGVLASSDGFVELPATRDLFLAGEVYNFYKWRP